MNSKFISRYLQLKSIWVDPTAHILPQIIFSRPKISFSYPMAEINFRGWDRVNPRSRLITADYYTRSRYIITNTRHTYTYLTHGSREMGCFERWDDFTAQAERCSETRYTYTYLTADFTTNQPLHPSHFTPPLSLSLSLLAQSITPPFLCCATSLSLSTHFVSLL